MSELRHRVSHAPVRACAGLLLLALGSAFAAGPVQPSAMPAAEPGDSAWQIAAAGTALEAQAPAVRRHEDLLFWTLPGGQREPATAAHLLIAAPYAQVQAAVRGVVQAQGGFQEGNETLPLSYLPDDWGRVLLSRRQDLRAALAERFAQPMLQAAVEQGALTEEEARTRLQQARERSDWAPQDRAELAVFRETRYAEYCATRSERQGLSGRLELRVCVFDMTAAMGHATTALSIERTDNYANPDYSVIRQITQFNPLGGASQPSRLSQRVVPAVLFQAVRQALAASVPQQPVRVAASPLVWMLPPQRAGAAPAIAFVPPRNDVPLLPFDALPWDALGGELATADSGARYPRDLLALPDGDLLLSMQVLGGTGANTRLWRLHHDGTRWQTETVWQGEGGAQRLMPDAQGSRVWFLAGAAGESAVLYVYDVASRRLHRYRVDGEGSDGYARWELDAAQRPVYFDHSYAGGGGAFGGSRFILNAPTAAVPAADGPWAFAPVFGAPRQALMDAEKKGNAQLWPVRLHDPHALWVEDAQGIAALDPTSGRVLRAFALPQRFGRPDPVDASGVAQWVPTPLGSLQGRWIASGFVLMLADHGTGTPQFAPSGASKAQPEARFVGMHVLDMDDGRVRLSALLGCADALKAAARSAHGRLLALGSDAPAAAGPQLALWQIAAAQTPLRLASPARGSLNTLAFSWDGATLWALTDGGLLRWSLPLALRDPAGAGSYPEHAKY
ncbi:hypothetical protein [uncultured Xanthomonas sp.]|uniref:hypothetical protein n=1 Tax=uncultured Xanthomonas sp. TaxID=152831 RepID=UPI0025E5A582|nr:hypothetical protein [uncultured Xanthomonas sp.]